MNTSSKFAKIAISRKIATALCVAASLVTASPMMALQPLATHHLREAVSKGGAKLVRPLAPTETLKLAIVLPLRNEAELDELLPKLSDPKSPQYHKWLTVPEFTEKFGPAQEDYDAVVRFAEANGMTVTAKSDNRMVVDVKASVEDINRTFHVKMGVYQHPTEARTFYAPDRELAVDLDVPLWRVAGLDNFSLPRPQLRYAKPALERTAEVGSGPGGQYLGSDFRAAYYGGSALTGAGQTIGLYGLDYNLSDVEAYFSSIGQAFNPASVVNYSTDGTVNSCGAGCDDGEPIVDIISSLSIAPGAKVIEYFGNSDVDTYNAMATANVAKQISQSVLWLPGDPNSDDPIFKEFAAQGQNLFVASLDGGAYSSTNPAWFPADDPYVTAVGGTDLTTNGPGGAWESETGWIGSGGGYSTEGFATPSYQLLPGVINSANSGSTTLRNVPDVAAEANADNYYCANAWCGGGIGGTSLAAPRWAGFMALVNEQAASGGKPSAGFLNPIIYRYGTGANYDGVFHDITSGDNNEDNGAAFNAVVGYDLVTGWGSPNGQNLINALSGVTVTPSSTCHVTYAINSEWAGTFNASITIQNKSTVALNNWTLSWTFANGQKITQLWGGNETQSGASVTVTSPASNGPIPAGGSYSGLGFNASWNDSANSVPTSFSLNGAVCK